MRILPFDPSAYRLRSIAALFDQTICGSLANLAGRKVQGSPRVLVDFGRSK